MKYNEIDFETYFKHYPDANGFFGKYGGCYIPEELKAAYTDREPLAVARLQMLEKGWLSEAEAAAWEEECRDEVQRLVAQAQRESTPNPADEEWKATSWNPEY